VQTSSRMPRHTRIGDIAILLPLSDCSQANSLLSDSVRVVVAKTASCNGLHRAASFHVLAGEPRLHTKHIEWGQKIHVDLAKCFFEPKLQHERRRVAELVQYGDRVLVPFAGVGVWPVILAARSSCSKVVSMETNPAAYELSLKNVATNKLHGMVQCLHGDVVDLPSLHMDLFDRMVVPRPKHQPIEQSISLLYSCLKPGGEAHIYDFQSGEAIEQDCVNNYFKPLLESKRKDEFEILRVARCPRASIGRDLAGRPLYRICLDIRRKHH